MLRSRVVLISVRFSAQVAFLLTAFQRPPPHALADPLTPKKVNAVMCVIGLAGMILSGVFINKDGKIDTLGVAVPVEWFTPLIGFAAAIFFVSSLSMVGVVKQIKTLTVLYVFFTFITAIVTLVVMIALALYGNQKSTKIDGADSGLASLEEQLEDFLVGYGLRNPADWVDVQTQLDCCGVDFEAVYTDFNSIVAGANRANLHTGPKCTVQGEAAIDDVLLPLFPTYSVAGQLAADASPVLGIAAEYFCETNVRNTFKKYTPAFCAVFSVFFLMQFAAIVAALVLMCKVPYEDGGMRWTPEGGYGHGDGYDDDDDEAPKDDASKSNRGFINAPVQDTSKMHANVNRMSVKMGFKPPFQNAAFASGLPPPNSGGGGLPPPPMAPQGGSAMDLAGGASLSSPGYGGGSSGGLPTPNMGLPAPNMGLPAPNAGVAKPSFGQGMKNFGNRMSLKLGFGGGRSVGGSANPFGAPPAAAPAAPSAAPPAAPAPSAPAPAKKKKAPAKKKKQPKAKKAKPNKAAAKATKPVAGTQTLSKGAPSFLAGIQKTGGAASGGLKKVQTNDRSGPSL